MSSPFPGFFLSQRQTHPRFLTKLLRRKDFLPWAINGPEQLQTIAHAVLPAQLRRDVTEFSPPWIR